MSELLSQDKIKLLCDNVRDIGHLAWEAQELRSGFAALRAKVEALDRQIAVIVATNATVTAERDRLREAGQAVDATWNADEPYPPYMDCVDTDALLQLRAALRGEAVPPVLDATT